MSPGPWDDAAGGAGIFLLSFLSEDLATLAGALLAALGKLSWPLAFASCFLGIWLGDLGPYGLARFGGRPVVHWLFLRGEIASSKKVARCAWSRQGIMRRVVSFATECTFGAASSRRESMRSRGIFRDFSLADMMFVSPRSKSSGRAGGLKFSS